MGKCILLYIFIITGCSAFCRPVSDSMACAAGLRFMNTKAANATGRINKDDMKLVLTAKETVNCFYVFSIHKDRGFVIVSADDNTLPILGYSMNNGFDTSNMNSSVAYWLEGYKRQIQWIVEHGLTQSESIKTQWEELLGTDDETNNNNSADKAKGHTGIQPQNSSATSVQPLLKTIWDQNTNRYINYPSTTSGISGYYNTYCPIDYTYYPQKTYTGCVATAMAQVMKYWNYPTKGNGYNAYNPANKIFGELAVNFGNTTYQWANMPDSITTNSSSTQTNAIAGLMYSCGVAVNMDYGINSAGGSSAYMTGVAPSAEYAFKNYFGYNNMQAYTRTGNYNDAQWIVLLETELNAGRPIMYDGQDTIEKIGHCFVADGYDVNNNIHINWGWSGVCNGYYQVNSLNPGVGGTAGTGNGMFNSSEHVIMNIQPTPYAIQLYNSQVVPSASQISYGAGFSITSNVNNVSSYSFSGDFGATVYDSLNNFVAFVAFDTAQTLAANSHFTNNIVFTTTGIDGMIPGLYNIYINYRPTGGSWVAALNNGTYINKAQIRVVNNNNIALYSAINISSGKLIAGQSANINLNIINNSGTTFKGTYQLGIYTMSGVLVQTIGTYTEANGLANGAYYSSPYISFNTSSINVAPGTYLLGLVYQSSGSSTVYWAGSGASINPLTVTVSLASDLYEPNDVINQSNLLSAVFANNVAIVSTSGANIHSSTDQDFYKIKLPAGYNYSIKPVLNSLNYSDNSNTYTLDGVFSLSTDSVSWSGNFKDTIPGRDTVYGGTTLFLHVSPGFTGATGSYMLEVNIQRISPIISGIVFTPMANIIPNVSLLIKSNVLDTTVNVSGNYSINLMGIKDTINASKNNDADKTNGVTALDVALIQSHILQKNILNSPYKIIAADVNGDNTVSVLDIVYIKRLILGIDTTFTATSTGAHRLWAFVDNDSTYNLADSSKIYPYYNQRTWTNLTYNVSGKNLVGCKLGDVNWDWNPAIPRPMVNNINAVELSYTYPSDALSGRTDGYVHLPVKVKNFKDMLGMQFTISFNANVLQWQGIGNNPLDLETGTNHAAEGSVSFLWVDPKNEIKTLEDGFVIMELIFKAISPLNNETLNLNSSVTSIAAYDKDENLHNIIINPSVINTSDIVKETWTVAPNPTAEGVVHVQMNLKEAKTIIFRLMDNTGKVLLSKKTEGIKGSNDFQMSEDRPLNTGTYYLQAIGVEGEEVKKILIK